ncbi:hypothetical protein E2320_022037 [Naja naja]|nr:hypothetical protein E2320_022037 [Naja naja]
MSHVYPHGALTLSWFQGEEQLDASKEMEEEEMEDSEDQLFVYHSELELLRVAEDVTYKCKATLEVDGKIFVQERLLTTADWKSSVGTTTNLLQLVSTEHTRSRTSVVTPTAAPTLESLTEDYNSITVVNNSTGSSYPTDQELTTKPLSTTEGTTEKPTTKPVSTTNGFLTEASTKGGPQEDACQATIVLVPAEGIMGGALRITCQAENCSRDDKVWWLETPVAKSQYHLEEAKGQSTLMVERVSLEHQGIYQYTINTDALFTIGATASLFGLIITGYITHRWQQRRRW